MKKILLGWCLLLILGVAHAHPIRSAGVGSTYEEAKQAAFRSAIEQEVGTVIVSNTEVAGNELIKNEILAYSSGYVNRYEVISNVSISGRVHLVLDVWVASSKISSRILSSNQGQQNFNGSSADATIQTWIDSKSRADKLLATVLADWPHRAFVVVVNSTILGFDQSRNPILIVNYSVEYNQRWLDAYREVLGATSDTLGRSMPESMVLFEDDPTALLARNRWRYWGFHDYSTLGRMRLFFELNEPLIKISLAGSGLWGCVDLPKLLFYNSETHYNGVSAIKIHPRARWSGSSSLLLSRDRKIDMTRSVDVRPARKSACGH